MIDQINFDSLICLMKQELSESLIGVYLHGSMAMGCFHPAHSDIDVLVVVKEKQTFAAYRSIAEQLLHLEDRMGIGKGFELSIVLESHVVDFVYPTPFEFHYSAVHRKSYRADEHYLCGGFVDPDLAAHFAVTYERGILLYGKPIRDLFKPVDRQFMMNSIQSDLDGAYEGISQNAVYVVLNLCRAIFYAKESVISSKREGGEWAIREVSAEYADMIRQCLAKYNGEADNLGIDEQKLLEFASYMLKEWENEYGKLRTIGHRLRKDQICCPDSTI